MKTLSIIAIVLGAIGVFEGAVYRSTSSPMGFHPTRGTVVIIVGVLFVVAGVAGLVIRSRRRAV